MRKVVACLMALMVTCAMTLNGADNPNLNYQNYNHGYCPTCNNAPCGCAGQPVPPPPPPGVPEPAPACAPPQQPGPCDPCAPVCGAECGISLCAIGVGVAALAAAAALIIASGSGSSNTHSGS